MTAESIRTTFIFHRLLRVLISVGREGRRVFARRLTARVDEVREHVHVVPTSVVVVVTYEDSSESVRLHIRIGGPDGRSPRDTHLWHDR